MSYFQRFVRSIYLWNKLNKYKKIKKDSLISRPHRRLRPNRRKGQTEILFWQRCKGFMGGTLISWCFFGFCIIAFRMSFGKITVFSSFLVTFLSFGLAFSEVIRCYTLMLLPQLFSKRGRQALAAYAFILALEGPARNSLHNIGILSSSFACGQEQVARLISQVVGMIREPLRTISDTLKTLVKDIKKVVQPIRDIVSRITQMFTAVYQEQKVENFAGSVIGKVYAWLSNVVGVCNKTTGTPYQRCLASMNDAISDCQAKLGVMRFLCSIVSVVKKLCATVKAVDTLCALVDVISDAVVAKVKRRLAVFRQQVADMLSVSIEMKHSMDINTTTSRSAKDVVTSIVTEIEEKTENVRSFFSWISILPSIAFIFLFIKVWLYRHKFLTSDSYDNYYINKHIVEIDLAKIKRNLPTLLPLELYERSLYTTVGSLRLVRNERRRIGRALIFLIFTGIQIGSYLISDTGIYWTIVLIRRGATGTLGNASAQMPTAGLQVNGHGALAELYLRLSREFQPASPQLNLQAMPCLPEAFPPDIERYIQIGVLMMTSFFLASTEPYGLRLRHVVMSHYFPTRARQRAVWLHNHIVLARGTFSTYAREQVRRRKGMTSRAVHKSLWKSMIHRNKILTAVFASKLSACLICGVEEDKSRHICLTKCPALNCTAQYCNDCIHDLTHCAQCYEYLIDANIEESNLARDSSDEEA